MIKVTNIAKNYQQGSTEICALKNINFSLERGETLSIVGPSGSGKTTLLSLIAGIDCASSGQININGIDLTGLSEKKLCDFRAQNLGIIFQQFHLMPHLTAFENIALTLEIAGDKNIKAKVENALESVGLENRATHLPSQLSGGEAQRVALARAIVNYPPLILADEPSGNLDTKTGDLVMDLLFEQAAKVKSTLVLVTHDHQLAKRCSQQIHLAGGMIQ